MKAADLRILVQEGEGTTLEFKEALPAQLARDLVAMANTVGGRILLGVRDDGTIAGIKDTNALRARVQDIARNCDPPVKVLVKPVGTVLVVHVRESEAKPVQCSDGFFWRQGAVTQPPVDAPRAALRVGDLVEHVLELFLGARLHERSVQVWPSHQVEGHWSPWLALNPTSTTSARNRTRERRELLRLLAQPPLILRRELPVRREQRALRGGEALAGLGLRGGPRDLHLLDLADS